MKPGSEDKGASQGVGEAKSATATVLREFRDWREGSVTARQKEVAWGNNNNIEARLAFTEFLLNGTMNTLAWLMDAIEADRQPTQEAAPALGTPGLKSTADVQPGA